MCAMVNDDRTALELWDALAMQQGKYVTAEAWALAKNDYRDVLAALEVELGQASHLTCCEKEPCHRCDSWFRLSKALATERERIQEVLDA